jgi:site-specific DNA recombinase
LLGTCSRRLDAIWVNSFRLSSKHIVRLLVEKVIVSPQDIEARLRANAIEELALELGPAMLKGKPHEPDPH